jgi:hypothetical protein
LFTHYRISPAAFAAGEAFFGRTNIRLPAASEEPAAFTSRQGGLRFALKSLGSSHGT